MQRKSCTFVSFFLQRLSEGTKLGRKSNGVDVSLYATMRQATHATQRDL